MKIKDIQFTAVFVEEEEGGFSAYIEEIPGVNTQGETIEEAKDNLKDAFELVIEANKTITQNRQEKTLKHFKEPLIFA